MKGMIGPVGGKASGLGRGALAVLLALILGLPAARAQTPIPGAPGLSTSGTSRFTFETASAPRLGQALPTTFARWEAEPVVYVYGVPLGVTLLLSNEGRDVSTSVGSLLASVNLGTDRLAQLVQDRIQRRVGDLAEAADAAEAAGRYDEAAARGRDELDRLQDLQGDLDDLPARLDELEALGLVTGAEKLALAFPTLSIGTAYPSYAPTTIDGITVTGVDLELAPAWAFASATVGNVRDPRSATGRDAVFGFADSLAFTRRLYAARLGVGRPAASHLILTGALIRDDPDSLGPVPLGVGARPLATPARNVLAGASTQLRLFQRRVTVRAQATGSAYTRDQDALAFDADGVPVAEGLVDAADLNLSSSLDFAAEGAVAYRDARTQTKVEARMKYVGPGYVSLGAPGLRNDRFGVDVEGERAFWRRQLALGLRLRTERTNLADLEPYTTRSRSLTLRLRLNVRGWPSLRLQVQPTRRRSEVNEDVDVGRALGQGYAYTTTQWSVASGYTRRLGRVVSTTTVQLADQAVATDLDGADDDAVGGDFGATTLALSQAVSLGRLSVQASYSLFAQRDVPDPQTLHAGALQASALLAGTWALTAGATYADQAASTLAGLTAGTSVALPVAGLLDVRFEHNRFTDALDVMGDFDQSRLTVSLTQQW